MPDNLLSRPDRQRGPSFICVGPERTGTSWLYANLFLHPNVFLTPVKELRYFYDALEYPGEHWRARLSKNGDWHTDDYRAFLKERLAHYRKTPHEIFSNWRRVRWDFRFLFGRRDDEWYLSLFDAAGGRICGDISPQYFSRPEGQKEMIKKLLPHAKIIILLRDPIDWCWSFARMTLIGDRNVEDIPDESFFDFFDRYKKYYPTAAAIDRWQQYFPPEQIHIGFHDTLVEAPFIFYQTICSLIGVDEQRAPQAVLNSLSKPVNQGKDVPIPHRLALHLAKSWLDEIQQLCERFSPYPQRWLQHCLSILEE